MSDQELLRLLGRVLDDGADLRPPPDRTADLLAEVERRRAVVEPSTPSTQIDGRSRSRRSRYVLAAAGIAAALVVGVLIGHGMPGPVRQVAHAVAPSWVESPDLHAARGALDDLGRALAAGDTLAVCAADTEMLTLVDRLSDREKDKIVPVAHEVHERAVSFVGDTGCSE